MWFVSYVRELCLFRFIAPTGRVHLVPRPVLGAWLSQRRNAAELARQCAKALGGR